MATRTIPIPVTMRTSGSVINIDVQASVPVPNSPDMVQLQWTISGGGTFPASNFFSWSGGSGQPAVSRNSAGTQLTSAAYENNNSSRRKWKYTIGMTNGTTTVNLDPEVDNQPPG